MNVASLELCKELYELSGWDSYLKWATFKQPCVINADEWARNMKGEPDAIASGDSIYIDSVELYSAYGLAEILTKLPDKMQIDEAVGNLLLNRYADGWQCGYFMNGEYMERKFNFSCNTPEDAAAKLAIELFKQGVLKRGEG